MVTLGRDSYTRAAAVAQLDAFITGDLSSDELRDWIDSYDWDTGKPGTDPAVRTAVGQLELAFHELDDGTRTMAQVNEVATAVRRDLC